MEESYFNKKEEYYQNFGNDLIKLIPDSARRVLDIGCGYGLIGSRLKESPGREVVGVEISPEAAEKAKSKLDQVYVGNIETMKLEFREGYFDCIVCGDVLEHLINPWRVIKEIKKFLAPGGYIIVSLPNISHWSVVRGLVAGDWAYAEDGIMDITHIRFFTEKSARKIFEDEGFETKAVTYRFACGKLAKKINKVLRGKLNHLLAWQYLIAAKKA